MSEFFTILPPPQSVDALDAWGGLESLPFSLDSAVWQSAGVYGLIVSEGGRSGETLNGANRVRSLVLAGSGKSSDEMEGEKGASVYEIAGDGQAKSGSKVKATVLRGLYAVAAAKAAGVADVGRVLIVAGSGGSESSDDALVGFKGWDWNGEKSPSAPSWEQKKEELAPWEQKPGNVAVWVAHSVPAKDWTQKHGGVATWQ